MRLRTLIVATLAVALAGPAMGCNDNQKSKPKAQAASKAPDAPAKDGEKKDGDKPAYDASKPVLYAKGDVAIVDGKPITAARFGEEVDRLTQAIKRVPPGAAENYKGMLLDRLVNEQIMELKVAEHGITVTDADYDKALAEAAQRYGGVEKFQKLVEGRAAQKAGPTWEEVQKDLRRTAGYKLAVEKEFPMTVPEAEIKKFYDENAKRFEQPERVRASHILLKVERSATPEQVAEIEKKAKGISAKARKKGADFAKLAKDLSEGPSAPKGGDLDYFTRTAMVKPFSDAAFAMKVGEVSDPVKSPFGWHVIKVTDKKAPEKMPFDEVKEKLEQDLLRKKERESLQKFIEGAEKKYKVERKPENIVVNIDPAAAKKASPYGGMHGGHGGHGGHGHAHGPNDGHDHGSHGHGHAHGKPGKPGMTKKLNIKPGSPNQLKLKPGTVPPSVNPKKLKKITPSKPAGLEKKAAPATK